MTERLAPLCYAAAGTLVAIALAARAPVFGASHAQASLLPWYLAIHALVLVAYAMSRGVEARLQDLLLQRILLASAFGAVLAGMAIVDAVVGVEGIFRWQQGGFWGVSLLLPALASGAALWRFFGADGGGASKETDEADEADKKVAPAFAGEGKPPSFRAMAFELGVNVYMAMAVIAALTVFAIGAFAYYALHGTLFDAEIIDPARVPQALREVFATTWPMLAVPGVLFLVYVVVSMLARRIPQLLDSWRYPNAARDLGDAELGFIDKALVEIDEYVQAQDFKRLESRVTLVSLGVALVPAIGILFAAIRYQDDIASFYDRPALGSGWHLLSYHFPVSALPALFLCLLLYWPVRAVLGHSSRYLSELLTWHSYASSQGMFSLRSRLVRDVRVGNVRADAPFKPGDFLHHINLDWAPYAFACTGPLALVTAVLWDRDARQHTLYTEDRIEVVDYWSSRKHSVPYSAVQGVELECAPRRKGGYDVGYRIILPDRTVDLLDRPQLLRHLADYEHVNAKLAAAGAHFGFEKRTPLNRDPFIAYSTDCVEETIQDFDAETGARVERLLHLSDWQVEQGQAKP